MLDAVNDGKSEPLTIEDEVLCYVVYHGPSEASDIDTYGLSEHNYQSSGDLAGVISSMVHKGWLETDDDDHGHGYVVRRYVRGPLAPQDNGGVVKAYKWLAQDAKERDLFDDCVVRILQNCPSGTTMSRLIDLLGGQVSWADTHASVGRLTSMYSKRLPVTDDGKVIKIALV